MKIAMPVWGKHVSTVLDFSENLLIVDVQGKAIQEETFINWSSCSDAMKVSLMQEKGVAVLLCGAVSKTMQIMVENSGINLIYGLRGMKDAILQAYLEGRLYGDCFRLPGSALTECPGRKRKLQNKNPKTGDTQRTVE